MVHNATNPCDDNAKVEAKAKPAEPFSLTGSLPIIRGLKDAGFDVQITGFGTFEAKHRKARTGRNPRTGQTIKIAATKTPAFRAGKGLKDGIK